MLMACNSKRRYEDTANHTLAPVVYKNATIMSDNAINEGCVNSMKGTGYWTVNHR